VGDLRHIPQGGKTKGNDVRVSRQYPKKGTK